MRRCVLLVSVAIATEVDLFFSFFEDRSASNKSSPPSSSLQPPFSFLRNLLSSKRIGTQSVPFSGSADDITCHLHPFSTRIYTLLMASSRANLSNSIRFVPYFSPVSRILTKRAYDFLKQWLYRLQQSLRLLQLHSHVLLEKGMLICQASCLELSEVCQCELRCPAEVYSVEQGDFLVIFDREVWGFTHERHVFLCVSIQFMAVQMRYFQIFHFSCLSPQPL